MIGQVLGHFTILDKLGEGGQGTVYLASDTSLDRKVALKVLRPEAVEDKSLHRRFIFEAKAVASLDHPNICTVYSIDEVEGQTLLAMALLAGETIRHKIERGPLPLDLAVDVALQTLEGLKAAHERGIIHRDIKSSNLMVVGQGLVKVMDFGLALASDRTRITQTNTVLGTPAYMSPEQVRGESVDHRSDLWSVGVVIHEMVTGVLPFRGENAHSTLMSILSQEPEPMTGLRSGVPLELDRIVEKALAKDPEERYQHADDFAADLRRVERQLREQSGQTSRPRYKRDAEGKRGSLVPWMIAVVTSIIAVVALTQISFQEETRARELPVMKLSLNLPEEAPLVAGIRERGSLVLSPDGRELVYVGSSPDGPRLYRRRLDGVEFRAVPETLGVTNHFFSPDSRWLGFVIDNELFKTTLDNVGVRVARVPGRRLGAAWASDGSIYFGSETASMKTPVEVLAPGSQELVAVTELNSPSFQFYEHHSFPQMLPGEKGLVFTSVRREGGNAMLFRLDTREQHMLIPDALGARFLPPEYLVVARAPDKLFAARFDLDTLEVIGEPVEVLSGVALGWYGSETWSISDSGILAYFAGNQEQYLNRLAWVNRKGEREAIGDIDTFFICPRVSPDGRSLLVQREGTKLRILNLKTGSWSRLAGGAGAEWWATWHPDSKTVVFNSDRESAGIVNLYSVDVTGGTPRRLTQSNLHHQPHSISNDGKVLIYTEAPTPDTGFDIWSLRLDGEEPPQPVLKAPYNTFQPILSPDSRWIAFASDGSGRPEVYVGSFPTLDWQFRVSTEGGVEPIWSPDGRLLYYRSIDGRDAYQVEFRPDSEPKTGEPECLFSGDFVAGPPFGRNWDMSPDGERFLLFESANPASRHEIRVVVNWAAEVEEKLLD